MDKDKYQTVTDGLYILQGSLNRIANALEEVLRLVKADQEKADKYRMENNEQSLIALRPVYTMQRGLLICVL